MHGPAHRLLGAAAGAALGIQQGWPAWQTTTAAVLAAVTSNGRLSPDGDLYRGWRLADRILPDEALGMGGPMQHRGITHWWVLPAVAGAALAVVAAPWWAWALLAGWISHLAGDFAFGQAAQGRAPGIPIAPWWGRVGLGLDSGGWVETGVRAVALPTILAWQACLVVGLDPVAAVEAFGRSAGR